MRLLFRRLLSFGVFSLVAAISPLFVLPVISMFSSPGEWASLLVGQVVGSFGATVVLFGWGIRGQARVASTVSPEARSTLYRESMRTRAALFLIVAPLSVLATVAISGPGATVTAGLMALAMVAYGFSLGWYSVGVGRALLGAAYESIPRLVAAVLAAVIIGLTGLIFIYPVLLIVATVVGLLLFQKVEFGAFIPRGGHALGLWQSIRSDARVAATSMLGAGYAAAPLPLAVALFGTEAASLATADRLYRYGLLALVAFSSGTHAWSVDDAVGGRARRQWISISLHIGVGVGGAVAFAALAPPISEMLFGATLAADPLTCWFYAIAFLAVSTSTTLVRNLLVPSGRDGVVLGATSVTVVIGLTTMVILAMTVGVNGVVIGLAASEVLSLAILIPPSLRLLRRMRHGSGYEAGATQLTPVREKGSDERKEA